MKVLVVVGMTITLGLLASACSKDSSTTTPDPPAASTRIIRLGGNLDFGRVSLANSPSRDLELTVSNDGSDTLEVSGFSGPCARTYLTVPGSTSFAVPPGGTVPVTFRFAPRVRVDCSGTITVFGNQTSGTNTIPVIARGVLPGCEQIPPEIPLPPTC